jgi:hypothetical protein
LDHITVQRDYLYLTIYKTDDPNNSYKCMVNFDFLKWPVPEGSEEDSENRRKLKVKDSENYP